MNQSQHANRKSQLSAVAAARSRWLEASKHASKLAAELFQPGNGYGDPEARQADEHRLQSAKDEVERLFREYHDLDRQHIDPRCLSYNAPND